MARCTFFVFQEAALSADDPVLAAVAVISEHPKVSGTITSHASGMPYVQEME